jgi:hypothetical protein
MASRRRAFLAHHPAAAQASIFPLHRRRHPELVHQFRPGLRHDQWRAGHATELLITYIYKAGFGQSRFDYAAALTVVQFLLLVVLTMLANKLSGGNAGSLER